jgi:hypothetical protein
METTPVLKLSHEDIQRSIEAMDGYGFSDGFPENQSIAENLRATETQLNSPLFQKKLKELIVDFTLTGLEEDFLNGWMDSVYFSHTDETIIQMGDFDISWLYLKDDDNPDTPWQVNGIWEHTRLRNLLERVDTDSVIKYWLEDKLDEFGV